VRKVDDNTNDALLSAAAPIHLYANTAEVEATPYDVAIQFGTLSMGHKTVDAVVRMSPQHAQSLVILLQRFLDLYREQVGDFALPEQLLQSLKGDEQ